MHGSVGAWVRGDDREVGTAQVNVQASSLHFKRKG